MMSRIFLTFLALSVTVNGRLLFHHMANNGDTEYPNNYDDDSTEIQTRGTYRVFDTPYTSIWVGTNGYLTFGGGYTSYVPRRYPFVSNFKLVAPLWSDILLSADAPASHLWYRETTDSELRTWADNIIANNFGNCGSDFSSTHLFIVTWQRLASYCYYWDYYYWYSYSSSDYSSYKKRSEEESPSEEDPEKPDPSELTPTDKHYYELPQNSFQIVLATDGCRTFAFNHIHTIEWRYCWNYNQMVFNAGDGVRSWYHPYQGSTSLTTDSNVGEDGRWAYRIDGYDIVDPTCTNIT